MPEPVVIEFSQKGLEQVTAAFRQIGEESAKTSRKVSESSQKMEVNYKQLAFSMSHVVTAGMSLESTWSRVAEGQMDVLHGILRSIPAIISMASALATLTAAEAARTAATISSTLADIGHTIALKAKAIALGIVHALSGPVGWAILAGAAGAAALVYGMTSGIQTEKAGVYTKASPLKFISGPLAGTTIHEGHSVNIYISGAGSPRETGSAVIDALRREGVI